jgi:hypothetical protein
VIYFDRTAPPALLHLLERKGRLAGITRMARDSALLDLQFRAGGSAPARVCLYFGLTALMSVQATERRDGWRFRIRPHSGGQARREGSEALGASWPVVDDMATRWLSPDELGDAWDTVLAAHLGELMPLISRRWTEVEGSVQSTLELTREVAVIDREVVLGYSSDALRRQIKGEITGRYLAALANPPSPQVPAWWGSGKHALGNELDLLCVDRAGRILLMELKPAVATGGIAWSPAQVSVYRELFQRWVDQDPDQAHRILTAMLSQRVGLGLVGEPAGGPGAGWAIRQPLELVPAIGIGGDVRSTKAIPRLRTVRRHLRAHGLGFAELELWRFGTVNRETLA